MIRFIICEDNINVRNIYEKIISKIVMPYDFDYKVCLFDKYNTKLHSLIKDNSNLNIYLLDLELPGKSGIDIAREIRKYDWDSTIIIITSHDELELRLFKEKLLILDFISKFDDYEKRLTDTINMVLKRNDRKQISFKSNRGQYHIKPESIIYFYRDNNVEKTIIVTKDEKYPVRESLLSISEKLDNRFCKSHKACYVNVDKIKMIDFKNSIIYFENGMKIDYLSRNYKKNFKEENLKC